MVTVLRAVPFPLTKSLTAFCSLLDDFFFSSVSFDQSNPRPVRVGVESANKCYLTTPPQTQLFYFHWPVETSAIKKDKKFVKTN